MKREKQATDANAERKDCRQKESATEIQVRVHRFAWRRVVVDVSTGSEDSMRDYGHGGDRGSSMSRRLSICTVRRDYFLSLPFGTSKELEDSTRSWPTTETRASCTTERSGYPCYGSRQ